MNQSELTKYFESVYGKRIDIDKYYGDQCWDLWAHYAMQLGVPKAQTYTNYGGVNPHSGYACNVYHNAKASGLTEWFDILSKDATPKRGDVAFWDITDFFPSSHVAIVYGVTKTHIETMSQNDPEGSAIYLVSYERSRVLGYLRPRNIKDKPKVKFLTSSHTLKKPMAIAKGVLKRLPINSALKLSIGSSTQGMLTGGVSLTGVPGTKVTLYIMKDTWNPKLKKSVEPIRRFRAVSGVVPSDGKLNLQVTGKITPVKNLRYRLAVLPEAKVTIVRVTTERTMLVD